MTAAAQDFPPPQTAQEIWQPTCQMSMLRLRDSMLWAIRNFFRQRGYLEVETPLLSHDIVVDAHLEPFRVFEHDASSTRYLQTSPEAGMKRLLAAGSGSIFQITRSFRQGELGPRHNPEFTMLEWYGVDTTWHDQMQLTEDLVRCAAAQIKNREPPFWERLFARTSYEAAFAAALGERLSGSILNQSINTLRQLVVQHTGMGAAANEIHDADDLLNLLLAECVEPQLGRRHPEFLCAYPLSQAALAEQNPADARTACRFELYLDGLELCNGYQELTDAQELSRRDVLQNFSRQQHGVATLPGAPLLTRAMQFGLPPCSGVALGFDRLIMSLTGHRNIREVMPFPAERA